MTGNEPFQLFTGSTPRYALVTWEETGSTSHFVVAGGKGARRGLSRAIRQDSDKADAVRQQLDEHGGMMITVDELEDGTYRLATEKWETADFKPPDEASVFGSGDGVEPRRLYPEAIVLKAGEYALIPVDLALQRQLEATVEHLRGLPGDLRSAMLQTVAGHGLVQNREAEDARGKAARRGRLGWLWILLAVVLGAIGGVAGYEEFMEHYSAAARSREELNKRINAVVPALRDLEVEIQKSSNRTASESLFKIYIDPIEKEIHAQKSLAVLPGEAWMLLRLALFRKDWSTNSEWTSAANDSALGALHAGPGMDPGDRNAVTAVACLEGPWTVIATPAECSSVDWNSAPKQLASLEAFVKNGLPSSDSISHYSAIQHPLRALENEIQKSKNLNAQALSSGFQAKIKSDSQQNQMTFSADSWMLLKLALLRKDPSIKKGAVEAIEIMAADDKELREKARAAGSTDPKDWNAVTAVACLQVPPASFVTAEECNQANWTTAPADLAALVKFVQGLPAPPPPQPPPTSPPPTSQPPTPQPAGRGTEGAPMTPANPTPPKAGAQTATSAENHVDAPQKPAAQPKSKDAPKRTATHTPKGK